MQHFAHQTSGAKIKIHNDNSARTCMKEGRPARFSSESRGKHVLIRQSSWITTVGSSCNYNTLAQAHNLLSRFGCSDRRIDYLPRRRLGAVSPPGSPIPPKHFRIVSTHANSSTANIPDAQIPPKPFFALRIRCTKLPSNKIRWLLPVSDAQLFRPASIPRSSCGRTTEPNCRDHLTGTRVRRIPPIVRRNTAFNQDVKTPIASPIKNKLLC